MCLLLIHLQSYSAPILHSSLNRLACKFFVLFIKLFFLSLPPFLPRLCHNSSPLILLISAPLKHSKSLVTAQVNNKPRSRQSKVNACFLITYHSYNESGITIFQNIYTHKNAIPTFFAFFRILWSLFLATRSSREDSSRFYRVKLWWRSLKAHMSRIPQRYQRRRC